MIFTININFQNFLHETQDITKPMPDVITIHNSFSQLINNHYKSYKYFVVNFIVMF